MRHGSPWITLVGLSIFGLCTWISGCDSGARPGDAAAHAPEASVPSAAALTTSSQTPASQTPETLLESAPATPTNPIQPAPEPSAPSIPAAPKLIAHHSHLSADVSPASPASLASPPMLAIRHPHGVACGLPIGLFSDKTLLMLPNGSIATLEKAAIIEQQITTIPFQAQGIASFRDDLQREFGNSYRVRSALPYVVLARPDRLNLWCERFQRFHQSMILFASTHGLPLRSPDFPLVAVVFGSRREFREHARLEQVNLPDTCVGYYSQKSNRILLFEDSLAGDSEQTLDTICHEATHQLAFNAGLHQRLAETPLWVVEGFAVQFEAPAFWNYGARGQSTRWPGSQREAWSRLSQDPRRLRDLVAGLIRSDDGFQSDTQDAYTAAWALTSYLAHRRSGQYVRYLELIRSLEPFRPYPAGDRLRDFHRAFGSDLAILVRQTMEHLEQLP